MTQPIFALGREEKLYVKPETQYGAADGLPTAANAVKFRELTFETAEERVVREDRRPTRSALEQIKRRQSANFSVSGYLLPSGSLGVVPPGWSHFLKAAFGVETVTSETSVVYTLAKEIDNPLTLHRAIGNAAREVAAEMMRGCVVNTMTFEFSGSEETSITAEGEGADLLRAGRTAVVSDDGDDVEVTEGHAKRFEVGQFINVGSATGLEILAIDEGDDILTVTTHAAADPNDAVVPAVCALGQTFPAASIPLSGVLGASEIEGDAFELLSATVTLNNGAQMHNDTYGKNKADGFHYNNREVTGQFVFRLHDANFLEVIRSKRGQRMSFDIFAGESAGNRAKLSLPEIIMDLSSIPSNLVEDLQVTVPFTGFADSGEDELSLTFN